MEVDTGTPSVLATVVDGVGTITLNRPDRRNALDAGMCTGIPAVLEQFLPDPDVGCIVVTGAGAAFCAGGDVRDGSARRRESDTDVPTIEEASDALARSARMVELLHESPKVTIASLPGPAVGAGLAIALATDLRIAARSARLIAGWGELAFSGDFGGTWFLTRLVGPSKAIELFVDNATIGAEEALELGLVNRVVDDVALPEATCDWARAIASGPTTAWRMFKQNVRQASTKDLHTALRLESERMVRSGRTPEHRDAVRAWLERAEIAKTKEEQG